MIMWMAARRTLIAGSYARSERFQGNEKGEASLSLFAASAFLAVD